MAHWKRGSAHVATGAIIGGLSLFLVSFVLTVYASALGALAIVAVLGFLAWQFVFG